MDAKEYFELKKCHPTIFGKYDMIEFAESYHQAKSKEEAEERYEKAYEHFYCNNQLPAEGDPHTAGDIVRRKGIRLAAFGKEEEG